MYPLLHAQYCDDDKRNRKEARSAWLPIQRTLSQTGAHSIK